MRRHGIVFPPAAGPRQAAAAASTFPGRRRRHAGRGPGLRGPAADGWRPGAHGPSRLRDHARGARDRRPARRRRGARRRAARGRHRGRPRSGGQDRHRGRRASERPRDDGGRRGQRRAPRWRRPISAWPSAPGARRRRPRRPDVVLLVDSLAPLPQADPHREARPRQSPSSACGSASGCPRRHGRGGAGHLSPLQGALLQEAIDVAVILNAMRVLGGPRDGREPTAEAVGHP